MGRPFEEAAAGLSPNIIQKEDIQRTGPALKKQVSENGILMAVVQKMPEERTKDPNSVFGWVKSGGSLVARNCSREIADNIKEGLKEERIPFFAVQKNGRVILIVKDKDEGKLTEAADRARKDKTMKNTILHGIEMNAMTAGKKKLVYLSGLTELEAAGIQKDVDKYSHGIQYSMSRMADNTWTLGIQPQDFISKKTGTRKHDFLQSYLVTMFGLYGSAGRTAKTALRRELAIEQKAASGILESQLAGTNANIYIYDKSDPSHAMRLYDGGYQDIVINSGLDIKEPVLVEGKTYLFTNQESRERFNAALSHLTFKESTANPQAMLSGIKERYTNEQAITSAIYVNIAQGENEFFQKMRNYFEERYAEAEFYEDLDQADALAKQAVNDFEETVTSMQKEEFCPIYMVSEQDDLARTAEQYGLDLKQYSGALDKLSDAEIELRMPEKEGVNVKAEIERTKQMIEHERTAQRDYEITITN